MNREFKFNNFDLLRIFAATKVVLDHSISHFNIQYPPWLSWLFDFSGVQMFFVISGFLISAAYERNPDLKIYSTNRSFRIFPALWVCLLITVIVISIVANISFLNKDMLPWFIAQCFGIIYTPDFLKSFGFGSYNGSLWTISVELQFYVILPMVYWLMQKLVKTEKGKTLFILFATVIFAALAIISAMYFTAVNFDFETRVQKLVRYSFVPHVYLFFLGALLYRCKAYKSDLIYNKGLFWTCAFLLMLWFFPPGYAKPVLMKIVLGIATISLAYTRPGIAENVLRGNDISYGVYIYHGLLVGLLVELETEPVLSVMITFAGAYILGFLSWKLVEQPVLSLKKKSLQSVKPTNGIKCAVDADLSLLPFKGGK